MTLQGLSKVLVGLGWDPNDSASEHKFDLDAALFMLSAGDKMKSSKDFIFYHNLASVCGSVKHCGDSLEGDGEGDDEAINVNLDLVPGSIQKLVVCVAIYDAATRKQNFGQVNNSYVRVVDEATGTEVCST